MIYTSDGQTFENQWDMTVSMLKSQPKTEDTGVTQSPNFRVGNAFNTIKQGQDEGIVTKAEPLPQITVKQDSAVLPKMAAAIEHDSYDEQLYQQFQAKRKSGDLGPGEFDKLDELEGMLGKRDAYKNFNYSKEDKLRLYKERTGQNPISRPPEADYHFEGFYDLLSKDYWDAMQRLRDKRTDEDMYKMSPKQLRERGVNPN